MKLLKIKQLALPVVLVSSMQVPWAISFAQEAGFADDFSNDSIRFSADSFDGAGEYSISPANDGLLLNTIAEQGELGSIVFNVQDTSDSFGIDLTHLSSSEVSSEAYVNAFLEVNLYSDNPNSADQNGEGTVEAEITLGYGENKELGAFYCLLRSDADGQQTTVQNSCGWMEGIELALDQRHVLDISLDKAAAEVTFSINGAEKVVGIGESIYAPGWQFRRIQLFSDGGAAAAQATLHSVRLGDETVEMVNNLPVFGRYTTNFELGTSVEIVDEKLAVRADSNAVNDTWVDAELSLQQPTDYLEAELTLSSDSDVSSSDFRVLSSLEATMFNTVADGGVDGRLGEVRANIYLEAQGNGLRRVEVCLQQYDDADGDARTGLLDPDDPNTRCDNLPILIEFDKTYRTSLSLDRNASTFTFRVNEISRSIALETDLFIAADPRSVVSMASRNDGIAVGTIDNIRSAPDALTKSEQTAGAVMPPSFPDPIDPTSIQVDSTIAYPFDFSSYEPSLDFIDDFSGITSDFGFWSGRERGGSGVSWSDGSIMLETTTAVGNDDGNWSEFYLDPKTDNLEAVVSLSSDTRFEPGNTGAEIQVRAIFYNDTQDYGFNDQEGDMEVSLRLQYEGDGRRRVRVQLRRRDASGSTGDNILEDIAEFEQGLMALVPELDRPYKLSLSIDRTNGALRFGVDDQFTDYQIPSGVFLPSQRRALISVNHYRGTGVSIGRIHSIKTDTIDEDFSAGAPVLAPYRPTFNAQRAGRLVEVVDGRLRLEADGTLVSGRDPRITALSGSDYVGATIELSSESVVQADGRIFIGVSGSMYNDLAEGAVESNNGNIFAAVRLTVDGNGERFVQYCAFRPNDGSFTEILGGDVDNCPRFTAAPELDTAYPAYVKLDRVASTLTFGFNGETFVHNITTPISDVPPFHGVRARTSDDSKVVAWADDLSFAENPVPLAESSSALVLDVTVNETDTNADGNSSGGGSIGGGSLLLFLISCIRVLIRKLGPVQVRRTAGL